MIGGRNGWCRIYVGDRRTRALYDWYLVFNHCGVRNSTVEGYDALVRAPSERVAVEEWYDVYRDFLTADDEHKPDKVVRVAYTAVKDRHELARVVDHFRQKEHERREAINEALAALIRNQQGKEETPTMRLMMGGRQQGKSQVLKTLRRNK